LAVGLTILHVTQANEAGVGRYVADLLPEQVARGWNVAVACPVVGLLPGDVGPLAQEAQAAGARHVLWPARRPPGRETVVEIRRLKSILEAEAPDVVHLHASKAGLAGRLLLRGRVPTVFQPHAWSFEAARGALHSASVVWERFAARWTDLVVCVSEGERERAEAAGVEAHWAVVPNGVDLEQFPPASEADRAAARERLGLGAGPIVVCVGRLSRQKGQDVLLDAWPEISRTVDGARLALVGSGPEEQALRGAAPPGVLFAGERTDVGDWYAAADVVTFPSRWEGMALTLLEAMARERSVVATDVAGVREALGVEAGAVVAVEQPEPLAAAIVGRLLEPERAAAEGRSARARAERSYDLRRTVRAVADLYGNMLTARGLAQ
jgi:glycosyltransferase involved in cell wall biosynthesis